MNKFVFFFGRLILVASIPLFTLFYIEYRLRKIETNYSLKRELLESQLDKIEVLSLGSSNAFFGINPAKFDYVGFNLSYLGQSMYYDEAFVLKYLERMPKLRLVLLPAIYFTMGTDHTRPSFSEYWRMYFYRQFYGFNLESSAGSLIDWTYFLEPRNFSRLALYENSSYDYLIAHSKNPIALDKITSTGWLNSSNIPPANLKETVGPNAARSHNITTNPMFYEKNLAYWGKLVIVLKKRNIVPVILRLPSHPSYYQYLDLSRLTLLNEKLRDFALRNELEYFDYTKDPRFGLEDFTTLVDHLSVAGADKFARIINRDILVPTLSKVIVGQSGTAKVLTPPIDPTRKMEIPFGETAPLVLSADTMVAWVGSSATYQAKATSNDVSYRFSWVTPLSGRAEFDEFSGAFKIIPDHVKAGRYAFNLTAYNGFGVGPKKTVTIILNGTREPSGVMSNLTSSGTTLNFGDQIRLHWEGSAPDGDLSYIMTRLGGVAKIVSKTSEAPATDASFEDSGPWGFGYTWKTSGAASQMSQEITWLPSSAGSYTAWGHVRTTAWKGEAVGEGTFNTVPITFVVNKGTPAAVFPSRRFISSGYRLTEKDLDAKFSNRYSAEVPQPTGRVTYVHGATGEPLVVGTHLPPGIHEILASIQEDANYTSTTIHAIFTVTETP